jgi:2-(1,2-epoxy-1,2-dihydrophenyl)acetyl-CoA isomerase
MELNDSPRTSRARLAKLLEEVAIALAELEKPTVAAVEGHAHGAGLSLALACDILIVAEDAQLSCAFAKVGLVPDCGALYFLPRRVPMNVAKELVFTGRRVKGAEAAAMGLANQSVTPGTAEAVAKQLAVELAQGATVALGLSKQLLEAATCMNLRELAQVEAFAQAVTYSTEDHLAARAAFRAKSAPTFTGR